MSTVTMPTDAIEHEGLWWKPGPEATATFDEFLAARALFGEINDDAHWNPWATEDRADELNRAMEIMDQWHWAEPNHRYLTRKQLDARLAASSRRVRARFAADDRRRAKDRERFDADKAAGRLALMEHESRLTYERAEVAALRSRERFPGLDDARRAKDVADLDASIARHEREIERLSTIVGDPEKVVDEHGWTPADRRQLMLTIVSAHRSVRVRELRAEIPELTAALKATDDKAERKDRREALRTAQRQLDKLLAIPRLTAEDMCSECATPYAKHGWSTPPSDGPCPAWPGWAARVAEARAMFEGFVRESRPVEPRPPPKPEPLAVIPSGLPIADVIARLAELQQQFPDAIVKRG